MKKIKPAIKSVGTLGISYNEYRNIIKSVELIDLEHVALKDWFSGVEKIWHWITGQGYVKLLKSFAIPRGNYPGLIHSFNSIVVSSNPWVVSFETSLPRETRIPCFFKRYVFKRFADDNCIGLVALSECARRRFLSDLNINKSYITNEQLEHICDKVSVLHPPQDVLLSFEEKLNTVNFDGALKLALVGHDFYRKGGLELLLALDVLLDEGLKINLSIVGKMSAGDYASLAGATEVEQAEAIIKKHSGPINLMGSLSSTKVLGILKSSHIVCLPTLGETYGYSVLEGQAAGCAAITTNIRALPEINNDECGWVIQVPKLSNGDGDLGSSEKRNYFREVLVRGLILALREAYGDRVQLLSKARASLARIHRDHDPMKHAKELNELYSGGSK